MKLVDAIEKRRSIRKFKDKKVKWSDLLEAIDAATKVPLAGNINTLKFIIVTDQETKNQIALYADQHWIAHANTIVVACSDETQIKRMYDDRGTVYARQQVGAALQNFLLRLTDLDLASCWIGAYLNKGLHEALEVPNGINIEAIFPIGYADEKPKSVKKEALESVIFWDKWNIRKKPTTKDPTTKEGN